MIKKILNITIALLVLLMFANCCIFRKNYKQTPDGIEKQKEEINKLKTEHIKQLDNYRDVIKNTYLTITGLPFEYHKQQCEKYWNDVYNDAHNNDTKFVNMKFYKEKEKDEEFLIINKLSDNIKQCAGDYKNMLSFSLSKDKVEYKLTITGIDELPSIFDCMNMQNNRKLTNCNSFLLVTDHTNNIKLQFFIFNKDVYNDVKNNKEKLHTIKNSKDKLYYLIYNPECNNDEGKYIQDDKYDVTLTNSEDGPEDFKFLKFKIEFVEKTNIEKTNI